MLHDAMRFNLGYLSARTAAVDPHRTAIIDHHNGIARTVSYSALEVRLNRVASFLTGLGLVPGDRIALVIGNRLEFIEAMYGALRAGIVPVMVNTKLGLEGLALSMTGAECAAAIVEPECNSSGIEAVDQAKLRHRILLGAVHEGWLAYEASVASAPAIFEPPTLGSNALADLCFTSGSSGTPKAVMASHRGLLMKLYVYANVTRSLVDDQIRTLVALPIFHANGRLSIGSAFETGGLVVIQPRFDARMALQHLANHCITYFLGVAPAYMAMLKEVDLLDTLDFSSLKMLFVGSAPSGGDVMPRIAAALKTKIVHTYGSTEAGVVMQSPFNVAHDLASCGKPFPGNDVKIIDVVTGEPSNFGELLIRNEWLSSGYWNRPDLTADKFVDGWYRSGDLFERDSNGFYYVRGRIDEMFNVGGEKVYPAEVEGILQQHPGVLSACVAAVPHESKGHVPAAMVISAHGVDVSEEELKQFFLQRGPAYAHPRRVVFAQAFPLAHTGKIDRAKVKELLSKEATMRGT